MRGKIRELASMSFIGFAGLLDTSFMIPIIALYAMNLGATEPMAGLIAGLYSIVAIPASILAGILVDRFGRKKTLALGLFWDTFSVLLYGWATSYTQLAIIRGIHAIGGSFVFPAFIARARETPGYNIGIKLGIMLAPVALAIAMGSALAGVTTSILGYKTSFTILSTIILLAGILSLRLPETQKESWKGLQRILDRIKSSGSFVFAGYWIIFTLYVSLGILVGGLATSVLKFGIVPDEREARFFAGMVLGASSLVGTIFMVINGLIADRLGIKTVITYSSSLSLTSFIIASILMSKTMIFIGMLLFGVSLSGLVLTSTILVTQAPPESRGTAVGFQQVFNILGIAVGAPLGGFLATKSPEAVLLSAGVASFLSFLLLPKIRKNNKQREQHQLTCNPRHK